MESTTNVALVATCGWVHNTTIPTAKTKQAAHRPRQPQLAPILMERSLTQLLAPATLALAGATHARLDPGLEPPASLDNSVRALAPSVLVLPILAIHQPPVLQPLQPVLGGHQHLPALGGHQHLPARQRKRQHRLQRSTCIKPSPSPVLSHRHNRKQSGVLTRHCSHRPSLAQRVIGPSRSLQLAVLTTQSHPLVRLQIPPLSLQPRRAP